MNALLDVPSFAVVGSVLVVGFLTGGADRGKTIHVSRSLALPMGAVAFLIALIQLLGELSDPGELGPALSVAFLPILYSVILFVVLSLFAGHEQIPDVHPVNDNGRQSWFRLLVPCAMLVVVLAGAMTWDQMSISAYIDLQAIILQLFFSLVPATFVYFTSRTNHFIQSVRILRNGSLSAAVVGSLVSWIAILHHFDAPTMVGPGFAVGLLSILYGGILTMMSTVFWHARVGVKMPGNHVISVAFVALALLNFIFGAAFSVALFA